MDLCFESGKEFTKGLICEVVKIWKRKRENNLQKHTTRPFPPIESVISVRSLKLPGIMSPLRLIPVWPFFTPTAESHGFSHGWLRLRSGCRTTKSRRLRSDSAKLGGATGLPVGLHWQIGSRIRQDILKEKRARYGEDLLPTLSAKSVREIGRGFTEKNLRRMVQFTEVFSDMEIVVTLSRQLSWSHFVAILPFKDDLQRNFYACRIKKIPLFSKTR